MAITLDEFFPILEKEQLQENERVISALEKENRDYQNYLLEEVEKIYEFASKARSKGLDPSTEIEIPIAKNMAERVERLLGIEGISKKIMELELSGVSREKICFEVAKGIVDGDFGKYEELEAIDKAVRSSVAILTEGVVAAPIEGIAKVKIDQSNGNRFLRIYYAGPIRSAGGTAQVISVLVGDYVRRQLGLNRYKPTELEILRYGEEIPLYRKVANLQYLPSDEEIRLIVSNCPVCIDGEPTEDAEVSGYRNIEGIDSNRVRGGMALVIAEGIALKAPKLKKLVNELGIDGWEWLDSLLGKKSGGNEDKTVKPLEKYLKDIVAGRPVFSHPSRKGGFRLRYGRARNSGFATVGINPATMLISSKFIAIGTQLKVERPGKAGGVVPVTSIEGPTVRLKNGDVIRLDRLKDAVTYEKDVDKILDIGEILVNYGDFLENNHPLIPSSYVYEWWIQELELKGIPASTLKKDYRKIDEDTALKICDDYDAPLHPDYTYLWHDATVEEIKFLRDFISEKGKIEGKYGKSSLVIEKNSRVKEIIEKLLVQHKIREGMIVIEAWKVFVRCLGLSFDLKKATFTDGEPDPLKLVNKLSGLAIRAKAPSRIGARMGRPEKARERKMSPPPHVLFPVGSTGGKTRDIKNSINYTSSYNAVRGKFSAELPFRYCSKCKKETFWLKCECGSLTEQLYYCSKCNKNISTSNLQSEEQGLQCPKCGGEITGYKRRDINIRDFYEEALRNLEMRDFPHTIKGVIGLTSKNKVAERMEKGVLRALHSVFVFKDGTIRYDMTDIPLTHFRPREVGISVERLKELGYNFDVDGIELRSGEQVVELKPQDIILAKDAASYILRATQFIDDLLEKFYGLERFYNATSEEDLIGHLVIGLAPHTSAGVLGRIIGFSDVLAGYAHPYFHAAKRRNCDGDEDCVMLLLDGLLNFSKHFLPERRGGSMDAPLVLTVLIDPKEVDHEVHNMDIVDRYPLKFYEATLKFANPKDLTDVIERVDDRLNGFMRYYNLKFTHDTEDISIGVRESAYKSKSLKTMQDKVYAQMKIAEKIIAVDEHDVAERVVCTHFLPDIIGNLRAFSRQEFRCVKCDSKYHKIPLQGKCIKCGGKLTLTVHGGSIKKYLEISKYLTESYNVREYTRQRLKLIDMEIQSIFESDLRRQVKISEFF